MAQEQKRKPDHVAEKQSPNYRAKNRPHAEQERTVDCHPVKPPAAPSSAAENHDAANQKCDATAPKTASKDQHEKATG